MRNEKEVFREGEIREFDRRIRLLLGPESIPEYTVEPHVVGIEVKLVYEKGSLTQAMTQGRSGAWRDVTPNIKTILTVPLDLVPISGGVPPPDRLEVGGGAYLEHTGERERAICTTRKTVAASLIGADLKETARRPYNFFCYGADREPELGTRFGVETHYEVMLALQNLGFRINRPHIRHCLDLSGVIENISAVKGLRGTLAYDVDGALIQVNPLTQRRALEVKGTGPGVITALRFGSSR
jgi:DNA ligase (NAD+)